MRFNKLKRFFTKRRSQRQSTDTTTTCTTFVAKSDTFHTSMSSTTVTNSTILPTTPEDDACIHDTVNSSLRKVSTNMSSRSRVQAPLFLAGRPLASASTDPMMQCDWKTAKPPVLFNESYRKSSTFEMRAITGQTARPIEKSSLRGCSVAIGLATDIVAKRRRQSRSRGLRALLCFPCILSYTCCCWWCVYDD
ncbi:hypothetical protein BDF22DRAFT_746447 [Syncephalis plumigaleata]|nr:hypothetical protein BDF22DRAFT_746447 [Syncephalis plumigaleata]